ncbi:MAG: hypothetical protein PHH86_07905, partial [Sphaerochaetaceae bacterium]|nr:hypothetical protein [Sphaerochaetaceae bacterium]
LSAYEELSGEEFVEQFNPDDIVNTAEAWDDESLVYWLYSEVLLPAGIRAIETYNGAIVFDETLLQRVEDTTIFQLAPPTDSEAFKKWFGDSKVVDENGDPLVVYHGTNAEFTEFIDTGTYENTGFWFTDEPSNAAFYTNTKSIYNIDKYYISLQNPKIIDAHFSGAGGIGFSPDADYDYVLVGYGKDGKYFEEFLTYSTDWEKRAEELGLSDAEAIPGESYGTKTTRDVAWEAKKEGYDGVIIKDVIDPGPSTVVVAFYPTQIKSVNNLGTWDARSPNILLQKSADERYFKALEAGDEETARKIEDDIARQKGYISGNDFRMNHKAPNSHDGFSARLDQLNESELLPNDFWEHPRWYTDDSEMYSFWKVKEAVDRYKKNGKAIIRLYRAIPKNVKEDMFRNGDWVTPDPEYARREGKGIPEGYRLIRHAVPIEHVWWDVNSIAELGYDDGGDYAYRDTKNNRKLNDTIVRDLEGNIIPPSKRFNYRSDTLYQLSPEAKQQLLEERKKDVQDAVENHFWVSSRILEEYLDEEWAQKEMATREYLNQFPWMLEEARQFATPDEYLQFIETMSEDAIEKGEQYKMTPEDADWYCKIFAYARIQSPQDLDKQFIDNYTKDKKSIAQLARAIKTYQDIGNRKVLRNTKLKEKSRIVVWKWGTFKGVSPYVKNFTENSSDEDFERAKKLIQENPRAYRKALRIVSDAEERVMAFKTHSSTSSYGYSREAYYDELDEDMLAALDEPLLLSEMTDREAAEYLRTTGNKQERFNAREKLATHQGVYAMELQADAEVKRLGEVKDSEIKKLQKQRERLASELKETGEQFKKARKDLRSAESALEKERSRSWELVEKLDEKSKQASKVNQLEKDLADRRARVKELRTQLTEKSREARRLNRQVTAYENREEARKTREKIERLMKVAYVAIKVSPSMDASYHPVFGWVQERLGLTSEYSKPDAPWKKKVDMLEDYLPRDVLDMLSAGIQIDQWSVEALQALVDGMRMLQRQARIEGAYRADQTRMRRDRIALEYDRQMYGYTPVETDQSIESVMGEIRDRLDNRKQNFYNGSEGKLAKMAHVFRQSLAHIWSFSEWLDGQKENGIMFKTFARAVWEYYQEEFRNVQRRLSAFDDVRKSMGYNQERLAKKVFTYTTPGGNEVTLNLEQAITAYIYSLNEKGLKKLIHASGNGMSHAILADLYQVLSEEDKQFAQAMIDAAGGDAEYMRLAEVFYRVYNHDLSREQNYFRFRAAGVEMENDIDLAKGIRKERFSFVEKGFGEDRTEAIYPLNLNGMKNLTKTIEEQEHLIHFGEWVRDANYLLGPKGSLGHEVRVTYGDTSLKTLQTFVKRIAGAQDTVSDFERMLNNLITQVSSSLISANLSSMMKQAASMSYILMGDISLSHAVRVMFGWSPTPEIRNWVHAYEVMCELDPSMKERTFDIEVKRSRNLEYTTKASRALAKVRDTGIKYTTQLGDSVITVKMWWGAYLTALDKFSNMEKEGRMREAVFYASRFIAETQSSSNPMDLAEIQTSRHTW